MTVDPMDSRPDTPPDSPDPLDAALRTLHAEVLAEPVPPSMRAAAHELERARAEARRWGRWGQWAAVAASVVLAFGVGWFLRPLYDGHAGLLARGGPSSPTALAHDFVRQASVAHMVYAPERRHPVEVEAAQQDHLVQWLSRRLGRPLKVPDLAGAGYTLVGGRLLPGADGARAQFMFEDAAGGRVTLYLGAITAPGGTPGAGTASPEAAARAGETAFRYSSDGPVPGFYWVDHGFGYALAGNLPRARLLELAERVYRQL